MGKLKVVVFDEQGGWVLVNPPPEEYINLPHVINPDLSAVSGEPPENWCLKDGKVVHKGLAPTFKPPSVFTKIWFWRALSAILSVLLIISLTITSI